MHLPIISAVLLVAATVSAASATEGAMPSSCTTTCAACLRATPHQSDTQAAATPKPWYIGPKGGDMRKGHSPSPGELWAAVHGNDTATAPTYCEHYQAPAVGPKGGLVKRSRGESDADVQKRTDAACLATCSR